MRLFKPHKGKILDLTPAELGELIGPIADANKITRVFLFGSRAKGDYDVDSDYDMLIDVAPDCRYQDFLKFKDEVSELLGCDVDVITRRSLTDDRFSRNILKEGVHVYG